MAKIDELAAREDTDRAGIALAFVLAHPSAPIAIIGSQNTARIEAAAQALSVSLTRQDVYALIEAAEGVPYLRKNNDRLPTSRNQLVLRPVRR